MGYSEEKANLRELHRLRNAQPNPLTKGIISGYKAAEVPRSRWDLLSGRPMQMRFAIHWMDSGAAIKEHYRNTAKLAGGKHTRNPKKRAQRKAMGLEKRNA